MVSLKVFTAGLERMPALLALGTHLRSCVIVADPAYISTLAAHAAHSLIDLELRASTDVSVTCELLFPFTKLRRLVIQGKSSLAWPRIEAALEPPSTALAEVTTLKLVNCGPPLYDDLARFK